MTQILKNSVPALTAIYPMAIVLIILALIDDFLKGNTYVYLFSMIFNLFVSILDALGQFGLRVNMLNSLPFYSKSMGWIVSAVIGAVIGFV